jgi:hypothetical protein
MDQRIEMVYRIAKVMNRTVTPYKATELAEHFSMFELHRIYRGLANRRISHVCV